MLCDRLSHLPRSQSIAAQPFVLYPRSATSLFQHVFPIGVEDGLPCQTHSAAVVSDVHDAFFGESISDDWVQQSEDFSAVADGRLASPLRRGDTMKPYPHRPDVGIGHLIVQWYILCRRVFRRGVDVLTQPCA